MKDTSDRFLVAEHEPHQRQPSGALGRALRIVDAGPRYFYRSALVALAGTSLLVMPIAVLVRPAGPLPRTQQALIAAGLCGLCVAVALAAVLGRPSRERGQWLDRAIAPEMRATIWLSLTVWFPFLLVVAYLKAKSTLPPSVVWISFGFMDKRWVTAAYLLGTLAPMLLLVAASRVLAVGREHPGSWRAWMAGLASRQRWTEPLPQAGTAEITPTAAPSEITPAAALSKITPTVPATAASGGTRGWDRLVRSRSVRVAAGVLMVLAIAYYFWGPPWYLNRATGTEWIGVQEDLFLGALQAISHGATPYIGSAASQYGPGTQLLTYLFARHIGGLSVVGFRESWALLQWAGASILFVVFVLAFGVKRGVLTAGLSALVYPALHRLGFVLGQAYTGFFGWANPLRYAGAMAMVLLLPAVLSRKTRTGQVAAAGVLGLFFGLTSYLAQENLLAGIVGAVVICALLLLTGFASFRSVVTVLLSAVVGFVLVWAPVVVYYAGKGLLSRFLYLYFLIPKAVAEGYSNTPYGGFNPAPPADSIDAPWQTFFYATPFILAVIALLMVVQFRPFRVATHWSKERVILVATVVTTILLYQGVLLRSDSDHLYGTELAVPALVIIAATVLPRLVGAVRRTTVVASGVLLFCASFLLFPYNAVSPYTLTATAAAPLRDRLWLAAEPTPATPTTIAGQRVGAGFANAPVCCQGGLTEPMAQLVQLMNQIHRLVGNRTTYVVDFPSGYVGIVYFLADLTPAATPIDIQTMVMNVPQEVAYMANFRTNVMPKTYALLTTYRGAEQARDFLRAYPDVRRITLKFAGEPYYLLLRPR
jgi:hypothetical protein